MNNWIVVLSIFAVVTFTGVAQGQTEAGLYRGEVLRTFQDTGSLVAKLESIGRYVSDLDDNLAETDMSPHQVKRIALSIEARIDGLQRTTAALSLFEDESAKHLLALNVTQIGDCKAQRDYGLALRMAKNALGKTLADFDDQQDSLGSAISMISDQRIALSEMQEAIGADHVTNDLQDALFSADLAYLNAQKLLVAVVTQVSHQRRVVDTAHAQLKKKLASFRSDRALCNDDYAKPRAHFSKVRGSLGNVDWHRQRCCV